MSGPVKNRIQVFDPRQDYGVFERRLPHWAQAGTACFMTWRTRDSIPADVLELWLATRDAWLTQHQIDPARDDWKSRVLALPPHLKAEFRRLVSDRWNEHLDECRGECVLALPELSKIVVESLQHFDGNRYELLDFVVMPNHVHLLAAFPSEPAMLEQCDSWKHFTATQINRRLNRRGRFWQQDGFDHLVRSVEQFEFLRRYIAENPKRARLSPGKFVHWSKPM
ncbi:MAG: transposase [Planctomycetes bacterium]|nr:transposase [Planctomycetota bacterium]